MTTQLFGRCTLLCCAAAALLIGSAASARTGHDPVPLVLGVVLPADDAALHGVRLGAEEAQRTAQLLGQTFSLHVEHAADAVGAAAAARRLIERNAVHAVIGGADEASALALMNVSDSTGVLFVNVGAPTDSLRSRCESLALHIMPSTAMRAAALRLAAIGDSAAAWHDSLERYGAGQVNDRFRRMFDESVDERAWSGWMAVKVVWESAQRAASTRAADLVAHVTAESTSFDGHKGLPLSFHPRTRQLRQPLYIIVGDSVIADVPAPRDAPDIDSAALLDRLEPDNGGHSCAAR